jgi:flagellar motor switch protein FliN
LADTSGMMPDLKAILTLEVPVIVRLGERPMTLHEVLAIAPGAILELHKHADAELDLLVNNKHLGHGQAVKVGENFGLQITYVGDLKARIEALGSQPGSSTSASANTVAEGDDLEALAAAMLAGQGG